MGKKSGLVDLSKTIEIDTEKVLKENKEKGLSEENRIYLVAANIIRSFPDRILPGPPRSDTLRH